MRRYRIEVDGRPFEVDVEDAGSDRLRVVVEGRSFDVALGGASEVASSAAAPAPAPAPRSVPKAAGVPAAPANGPGQGPGDTLSAPMPGRILRLAVAAGASVQRGQDIAVLEAMKMENVIRSPRDGRIAEVCVQEGQQVAHGAPIVRFAKAQP